MLKNKIKAHFHVIRSMSIFPSGKMISVSGDKSIKIWDINLNILQCIINAHNDIINYVDIKDEKNFATCSFDNNIKTWVKNKNSFVSNIIIKNAHLNGINKIIYCSNGNIISCSCDKKIKIWELSINKYQLITIIDNLNNVTSLLLINNKNLLISSGEEGTKFWNINNITFIYEFKEVLCGMWNALKMIDENRIIIGGKNSLKVISLIDKQIINTIENEWRCNGICVIEKKGIFLVSGWSNDIKIFKSNDYKCIEVINDAHKDSIVGIIILKTNLIASYSCDKNIKIWDLSNIQ